MRSLRPFFSKAPDFAVLVRRVVMLPRPSDQIVTLTLSLFQIPKLMKT